jgi:hypothetical protein
MTSKRVDSYPATRFQFSEDEMNIFSDRSNDVAITTSLNVDQPPDPGKRDGGRQHDSKERQH